MSNSTRTRASAALVGAAVVATSFAGVMWLGFPPDDRGTAVATVIPPLTFAALAFVSAVAVFFSQPWRRQGG